MIDPLRLSTRTQRRATVVLGALLLLVAPLGAQDRRVDLPGAALFPEGIAIHARTGDVFVGSVGQGEIIRIGGGYMSQFAGRSSAQRPLALESVIGLAVDSERDRLFVTSTPFMEDGAIVQDPDRLPQVVVLDTGTGRELARLTPPRDGDPHFFNDVAVGPDGTAWVTDSYSPIVWRIDPDLTSIEVWRRDEQFRTQPGFLLNGVAVKPDGSAVYVSSIGPGGGLWKLTPDGVITRVEVDGEYFGSDGLLFVGDRLLGIDAVVMELKLNEDGTRATIETIETPQLDLPTTLAWHEGQLWITNSQMDHYVTAMFPDRGPPEPFWLTIVDWPTGGN